MLTAAYTTRMHLRPPRSSGKERDVETGNDYFTARYYNSNTGRFLSPDWSAKVEPVPYAKLDNPQSLNLYAYVLNNPLSGIDADGHAGCSTEGIEVNCASLNEGAQKDMSESEQRAETMLNDAAFDDGSSAYKHGRSGSGLARDGWLGSFKKWFSRGMTVRAAYHDSVELRGWYQVQRAAEQAMKLEQCVSCSGRKGSFDLDSEKYAMASAHISYLTTGLGIKANNENADRVSSFFTSQSLPLLQKTVDDADSRYRQALHQWQSEQRSQIQTW